MKRQHFPTRLVAFLVTLMALMTACSGRTTTPQATPPSTPTPAAPAPAPAKAIQNIRFGVASEAISPLVVSIAIPESLGYYKEEGLSVEIIPLGSNAAVHAALESGRIEFGVGVPSFQIPVVSKGDKLPGINFYEYTYPLKNGVAVLKDSPYQKLSDLKGKVIGVSDLGISDYPIGQAFFRLAGLDPKKDVEWLATGRGTPSGNALVKGDIAALVYFDTGFGQLEASGFKLRYLPLPENTPKIGGLHIAATQKMLDEHRDWAVGFARGISKGALFTLTNTEAAAKIYLKMYPEAAPRGVSEKEAIESVVLPVTKRMPLFRHYDKSITKWGFITETEFHEEAAFLSLSDKIKDVKPFFTNALIDDINKFDAAAIEKQAREFK